MKSISIIIPIYNVENYLAQCLDSIYSQLTPTMEVILVNDGSKDNSLAICQEYLKKYPGTILIDKKNGGLSDARNAGTEKATGKYVFYLDSDDWLVPNTLQQLYEFAEKNQCEVVQGNFYYAYNDYLLFDDRFIKEDQSPFVLNKSEAMKELIKNEYIKNFAWGKLILTSIAKKYPFKKGVFFEDAYWKHHIIHETNRYGVLPIPVCYYRQREGSISGNFSIHNLDYVWCDYKVINKDNVKINSQNCPTNKEDLLRKLILGNYFMGALWNRMIKSSIVKNVSIINPVAPIIEDLTLVTQYTLLSERFGYINQPFYNYIIHEGGTMSSTKVRKRRESIKKNFQIILSCLHKNGWNTLLKDEIFINKFNQKQGYLPLVVEEGDHQSWINLYPEINLEIFTSPHISFHDKIGSLLILLHLRSFIYKLFNR